MSEIQAEQPGRTGELPARVTCWRDRTQRPGPRRLRGPHDPLPAGSRTQLQDSCPDAGGPGARVTARPEVPCGCLTPAATAPMGTRALPGRPRRGRNHRLAGWRHGVREPSAPRPPAGRGDSAHSGEPGPGLPPVPGAGQALSQRDAGWPPAEVLPAAATAGRNLALFIPPGHALRAGRGSPFSSPDPIDNRHGRS